MKKFIIFAAAVLICGSTSAASPKKVFETPASDSRI